MTDEETKHTMDRRNTLETGETNQGQAKQVRTGKIIKGQAIQIRDRQNTLGTGETNNGPAKRTRNR